MTSVLVLGAGSSAGTPVVACTCPVCTEAHPRNLRSRASCLIEHQGVQLLVDTGPDMRTQMLREKVSRVDAVLYTHPHADHLNGIDDLRAFCFRQQQAIPVYGNPFTMRNIEERFGYVTLPPTAHWERPVLTLNPVEAPFTVQGVQVTPIPLLHGNWPILGYRVGKVAWLTDVSTIPESSWPLLEGLELLFLDCLRQRPHHTHMSLDEAMVAASRIQAQQTWFIHMTHDIDANALRTQLPDGMDFAWDGLRLTTS